MEHFMAQASLKSHTPFLSSWFRFFLNPERQRGTPTIFHNLDKNYPVPAPCDDVNRLMLEGTPGVMEKHSRRNATTGVAVYLKYFKK
jgi:hypothetical protein